jgi:hypothetical protein
MNDWIALGNRSTSSGKPASAEALAAFEAKAGFALHPSVHAGWTRADGFSLGRRKVLSLAEAARYLGVLHGRLFAFTEEESNPFCVACDPILDGRVLLVFHDGDPVPAFRTLDGFARALLSAPADARLEDLELEYGPRTARSDEDVAAGQRLLATMGPRVDRLDTTDGDAVFHVHIGCALLTDAAELAPGLEWRDDYARQAVEQRLRELDSPLARETLRAYQTNLAEFDERCIAALKAAGFSVTGHKAGDFIRIGPPAVGLNMRFFYDRRSDPDAMEYVIARARALTELARQRESSPR